MKERQKSRGMKEGIEEERKAGKDVRGMNEERTKEREGDRELREMEGWEEERQERMLGG